MEIQNFELNPRQSLWLVIFHKADDGVFVESIRSWADETITHQQTPETMELLKRRLEQYNWDWSVEGKRVYTVNKHRVLRYGTVVWATDQMVGIRYDDSSAAICTVLRSWVMRQV